MSNSVSRIPRMSGADGPHKDSMVGGYPIACEQTASQGMFREFSSSTLHTSHTSTLLWPPIQTQEVSLEKSQACSELSGPVVFPRLNPIFLHPHTALLLSQSASPIRIHLGCKAWSHFINPLTRTPPHHHSSAARSEAVLGVKSGTHTGGGGWGQHSAFHTWPEQNRHIKDEQSVPSPLSEGAGPGGVTAQQLSS